MALSSSFMSRRACRAAIVVAGATGLTGAAACETILGLDVTLSGDDGGTTVADDGSISGNGANDAATDGERPDAEAGNDAAASPAGPPWALDPSFGDGGVAILLPPPETVAIPGTLEIAHFDTSVLVLAVGQSTASGEGEVIVQYATTTAGPGSIARRTLDGGANHLLGILTTASGTATRAVMENSGREIYAYDPMSVVLSPSIANDSGAEIARLTVVTPDGFAGPGLVDGGGVEAAIGTDAVVLKDLHGTSGDLLLAEAASDAGEWYGGYEVGGAPHAAVLLLATGGSSSFAKVQGAGAEDDFAVTDFALTDGGLFAVGYSGSRFAVWPAALDAGAPRTIAAGQAFTATPTYRAAYPYSFVRAVVSDDGQIVACGSFGAPFLATFDAKGMPTPLLTSLDGGDGTSLVDLTPRLPLARDGGGQGWLPGGLLANGDDLYATFASGATDAQWVVVRLKRVTP